MRLVSRGRMVGERERGNEQTSEFLCLGFLSRRVLVRALFFPIVAVSRWSSEKVRSRPAKRLDIRVVQVGPDLKIQNRTTRAFGGKKTFQFNNEITRNRHNRFRLSRQIGDVY